VRVHAGQVSRLWFSDAINEVSALGVWLLGAWPLGVCPLGVCPLGVWPLGVWPLGVWLLGVSPLCAGAGGDVDGSAPWFVLPAVVTGPVGVAAGLDGGGLVGVEVGDGDCVGVWDGLDVEVGDADVADGDGELDMVGDGDSDGDCVGVAVGDAEGAAHVVVELPG
jgi:hypothetical protein